MMISLTINNQTAEVVEGTTLLSAIQRLGMRSRPSVTTRH